MIQPNCQFISAPASELHRIVKRLHKNPEDQDAIMLLMVLSSGPTLLGTPLGMVANKPNKFTSMEVFKFSKD